MHGDLREAGFATIPILLLITAFATVAAALVAASLQTLSLVRKEVNFEAVRLTLRSAADLEAISLATSEGVGLSDRNVQVHDRSVHLKLRNEQDKTDINRGSPDELMEAFVTMGLGGAEGVLNEVLDRRGGGGQQIAYRSIDDFLSEFDFTDAQAACARQLLTPYATTFDPLTLNKGRSAAYSGAIVSISTSLADANSVDLAFEKTVIVTGDRDRPLWTVSERFFRPSGEGACGDNQVQ